MINKLTVLFLTLVAVGLTSCVSKKKFLEMQDGRMKAEQQVQQLTEENNSRAERIKALVADYEAMKNELLGSNAEKDEYIDNLNKVIANLKDQLNQQKESLQSSTFTYGFEKERLAEELQVKDKTIRSLQLKINELEGDSNKQSTLISERNIRMSTLNDRIEAMEAERALEGMQQKELLQQVEQLKMDIDSLNTEISIKDENIIRLQNNVNLLKREMGGN